MTGSEVYFIDGTRTPFGRAGEKGMYWGTRADDLAVKAMKALVDRNPEIPAERYDDVAIAATSQTGDQGPGRSAAVGARPGNRPDVRGRAHLGGPDGLDHRLRPE